MLVWRGVVPYGHNAMLCSKVGRYSSNKQSMKKASLFTVPNRKLKLIYELHFIVDGINAIKGQIS